MNARIRTVVLSSSLVLGGFASADATGAEAPASAYRLVEAFHVGETGSWDYFTVDAEHHLLFVPRSTHTIMLDASTGSTVADIPGQKRNHGVALVPSAGRGFISDGDDASVVVFDLKTYRAKTYIKSTLHSTC